MVWPWPLDVDAYVERGQQIEAPRPACPECAGTMHRDPAEELALWRYHLIAEALSPRLSGKERGPVVRRLAGQEHVGPDGQPCTLSRNTLDRWIRAYREHGLSRNSGRGTGGPGATRGSNLPRCPIVLLAPLDSIFRLLLDALVDRRRSDATLRLELLVLRHQLRVLERQVKRPR